jgi:hypothetical protein
MKFSKENDFLPSVKEHNRAVIPNRDNKLFRSSLGTQM